MTYPSRQTYLDEEIQCNIQQKYESSWLTAMISYLCSSRKAEVDDTLVFKNVVKAVARTEDMEIYISRRKILPRFSGLPFTEDGAHPRQCSEDVVDEMLESMEDRFSGDKGTIMDVAACFAR